MTIGGKPLLIWGTGGHASSVLETALAVGAQPVTFVAEDPSVKEFNDHPCLPESQLGSVLKSHQVVIAVGDNFTRQRITERLMAHEPLTTFATLVHPSATVSRSASLEPGTVTLQGAIIGARSRVGAHCIINTGASVDHECVLGDFSSLAPGVVTGGRVHLGTRSAIGIGAAVRHNIAIGSDSVVGSASYVHTDIPDRVVAYGVPARVIRPRNGGDAYLS